MIETILLLLILFAPVEVGYSFSKRKGFKAPSLVAGVILLVWGQVLWAFGFIPEDFIFAMWVVSIFLIVAGIIQYTPIKISGQD